ncbi:MAG: hypothetical protein KAW56_08280, partial [Candidatus Marinimicrobia bacterium]|nr:hypothetical protein [Candidatus Neomarinimicrobiota bacterium]
CEGGVEADDSRCSTNGCLPFFSVFSLDKGDESSGDKEGSKNPWRIIGGAMHYFPEMSMRDILWNYSYTNLAMLMSSIPSYKDDKKKKANDLEIKDINEIKNLL